MTATTHGPNVIYFHVDNLGYGELGCYGGGALRGARTRHIDQFAREGFQLLNFAPEAQCTPSHAALLTGRHAIRTGNHTAAAAGADAGIVAWERTLGDVFSDAGYATMCLGRWRIGDCDGRRPTDHGFDVWYGPPQAHDERIRERGPWHVPGQGPVAHMLEARKDERPRDAGELTFELRRNVDADYKRRAFGFMEEQARAGRPFLLCFNHSLMHFPVVPRDEYAGRSGNGDLADCLLQLDGDFGDVLDKLDALGLARDTIVVFAGDNGNEEMLLHPRPGGFFEGSYFTGLEASLRTPCIARWPGRIAAGRRSDEIVHVTDWFTTLLRMAGLPVPADRVIDGKDQTPFLAGTQGASNRDGFLYWNGERLYGVKWQHFKLVLVERRYFAEPAVPLGFPHVVNLVTDPKEREPFDPARLHDSTMEHFGRLMTEFARSVLTEPLIPSGAPLDFVPRPPAGAQAPKGRR